MSNKFPIDLGVKTIHLQIGAARRPEDSMYTAYNIERGKSNTIVTLITDIVLLAIMFISLLRSRLRAVGLAQAASCGNRWSGDSSL